MGEDFPGQKRQQDRLQYSIAGSFCTALVTGCAFTSIKAGWYAYLIGLIFTWVINIVQWDYFFAPPASWTEGKYLDITGFFDLEARERMALNHGRGSMPKPQRRSRITLFGGSALEMTISSTPPSPKFTVKKWR